MAAGLIGLFDLSIVTDRLIQLVKNYRDDSPVFPPTGSPPQHHPTFAIDVTGAAPDAMRSGSDCILSIYLFHVAPDKHHRNVVLPPRAPVAAPAQSRLRAAVIPFQPLALDLYYLVTAWAGSQYIHEQQAMSIALRAFYENPVLRLLDDAGTVIEELTVTMELETAEELGRLWQAVATSARLAAVYKVSVVFMTPAESGPQAEAVKSLAIVTGADPSAPPVPASHLPPPAAPKGTP